MPRVTTHVGNQIVRNSLIVRFPTREQCRSWNREHRRLQETETTGERTSGELPCQELMALHSWPRNRERCELRPPPAAHPAAALIIASCPP